jgi:hypothetical protein
MAVSCLFLFFLFAVFVIFLLIFLLFCNTTFTPAMVPVTALRTCFATPDPISPAALTAPVAAAEAALVTIHTKLFCPAMLLPRTFGCHGYVAWHFGSPFYDGAGRRAYGFQSFTARLFGILQETYNNSFGA